MFHANLRALGILLVVAFAIGAGMLARGDRGTFAAQTVPPNPPRDDPSQDKPPTTEPAQARPPRADETPVYEAKPGRLRVTVVERGNLEASRTEDVQSEVEGNTTILKILPEGTQVKKGQVVCVLDSSNLQDRLTNQVITINGAETAYQRARLTRELAELAVIEFVEGIYALERSTLRGEISAAQVAIKEAENQRERTGRARKRVNEALAAKGAAATPADIMVELNIDNRLEAAGLSLDRKKLSLELAQTRLHVLEKYTRDKRTKELQVDVERKRSDELAKQATWELEKSKEQKLRNQIAHCTIHAPADGLLVYANDPNRSGGATRPQIEEGAMVRERQKIFSLPDITKLRVNTKVHEAIVDKVSRGMRARITVDAFPNLELQGAVFQVNPLPDPSSFFRSDIKVYTTLIAIENGPPGLRPGMTVRAEILVTELNDVLGIPLQAVVHAKGKDYVFVTRPDGFELKPVTLGVMNDQLIEVKQGIKSGERVVVDPSALLSERELRTTLPTPDATKRGRAGPGPSQ